MDEKLKRKRAVMRTIGLVIVVAVVSQAVIRPAAADELMYGCRSRPACGKACKLVCDTTTLIAVVYGCECQEICIPGPSRRGCKHCETRCCCDDEIKGCRPKIEFCWYDWFACGCARPRTVRVLTKYQAEKEVPSYHWEVVDGCNCCCPGACHCVYKPAPPEAQVGDVLALRADEQGQLASYVSPGPADDGAAVSEVVGAAQPTSLDRSAGAGA